jgi:haloalkane dehalogenase
MRPDWYPNDLFPYESHFLDVEAARVHYVDEGKGPVLLMLHGNPTWSFLYRHIIAELRHSFRCIALDYPGFGLSRAHQSGYDYRPASHAEVVHQFVQRLDLRDITFVMQDWGGPIGLSVAARNRDRIRAFVIGNTWAWPLNGDPHFERFAKGMSGMFGRFAIRNANAFVNLMIPAGTVRKLSRAEMKAYRAPFPNRAARKPTEIFPRELLESRDLLYDLERELPAMSKTPTLFVWGEQDIAFRDKELRRFKLAFPNHTVVRLPDAGHYIQEDSPARIAQAISDFLA